MSRSGSGHGASQERRAFAHPRLHPIIIFGHFPSQITWQTQVGSFGPHRSYFGFAFAVVPATPASATAIESAKIRLLVIFMVDSFVVEGFRVDKLPPVFPGRPVCAEN
jgi:hypothetical protein